LPLRQAFQFFEALPNIKGKHTYIQMGTHVLQLQWKKGEQVFVVQPTIRNLIEEKIIGVESIEANGFQVSTLKKP